MSASRPPPSRPRRPLFLVFALALAWVMGVGSLLWGCNDMAMYRATQEEIDLEVDAAGVNGDAERAEVHAHTPALANALETAKARGFPLAVATFVIGAAMVLFAQKAMAGQSWARDALVQLVLAHAALVAVGHWLLSDARKAFAVWWGMMLQKQAEEVLSAMALAAAGSAALSLLIAVGLALPSSRAFYRAMGRGSSE